MLPSLDANFVHHAEHSKQNLYMHLIKSLYPHVRNVQAIEQDVPVKSISLNPTLQDLNLSPLKLHSVAPYSRLSVGKTKVNQMEEAM